MPLSPMPGATSYVILGAAPGSASAGLNLPVDEARRLNDRFLGLIDESHNKEGPAEARGGTMCP